MPEKKGLETNGARRSPANFAVSIALDENSSAPLYEQLAAQIIGAIESMILMPEQLMPSSRELSDYLQVSRKTVVRSYEELVSRGFLTTARGVGTRVRKIAHKAPAEPVPSMPFELSAFARRIMDLPAGELGCSAFPQLNHGAPPSEALPSRQWRQIIHKYSEERGSEFKARELEPFGQSQLRKAIASYLQRQRAMECDFRRVVTYVDSTTPARLAAQLTIDPGDLVAIEDPGYPYARRCFQMLGAQLLAIPVDQDGMQVEKLISQNQKVKAVYVTPSHQDPYGGTLSLSRRKSLLAWANQSGTLIFEDDYENEFFYGRSNLPCLYSLDTGDQVIYLSSFYKTLFPLSDAGIVVLPERLVEVFHRAQEMYSGVSSCLSIQEQVGITRMLDGGILERQIRKAQALYQKRRNTLIAAISSQLRGFAEPLKISGAMTIIIRFDRALSESFIVQCARIAKFPLAATKAYYWQSPPSHEFLASFAILDESSILPIVRDFARLLGAPPGPGHS